MLAVLLGFSGFGCSNQQASEIDSESMQTLTIGVLPDVDSIPFIIAAHNGYFEEEGLNVKLEHFNSAVDRDAAFQTGNVDGVVSDILAAIFLKDSGLDVKITSKTDGLYHLIAAPNSDVSQLAEIKGGTIGISQNTIIEYLTDKMLENVSEHSTEKVFIPKIPTRLEMLRNNKINMATLPEPLASVAVHEGGKPLTNSEQLGLNPGIMLFTQDAIEKKGKEIKACYRAYNRAVEYLKKEPLENYIDVLIEEAGFPETIKDTLTLPDYQKASMPDEQDFKGVLDWMRSKELTDSDYSLEELADDSFIEK